MDVVELLIVEIVGADLLYVIVVLPELTACYSFVDSGAEIESVYQPFTTFLLVLSYGFNDVLARELLEIAEEGTDWDVVSHAYYHVEMVGH